MPPPAAPPRAAGWPQQFAPHPLPARESPSSAASTPAKIARPAGSSQPIRLAPPAGPRALPARPQSSIPAASAAAPPREYSARRDQSHSETFATPPAQPSSFPPRSPTSFLHSPRAGRISASTQTVPHLHAAAHPSRSARPRAPPRRRSRAARRASFFRLPHSALGRASVHNLVERILNNPFRARGLQFGNQLPHGFLLDDRIDG